VVSKLVTDVHTHLYHYTTAAGLQGIITSQQLWATHIAYLNDFEEHVGFFDRRLPKLLDQAARTFAATPAGIEAIAALGSLENVLSDVQKLRETFRKFTVGFNTPYVSSFSNALTLLKPDDGLLSQWRGYGPDGGYAIVFDAKTMDQFLAEESSKPRTVGVPEQTVASMVVSTKLPFTNAPLLKVATSVFPDPSTEPSVLRNI
jgi:hypothetical protein